MERGGRLGVSYLIAHLALCCCVEVHWGGPKVASLCLQVAVWAVTAVSAYTQKQQLKETTLFGVFRTPGFWYSPIKGSITLLGNLTAYVDDNSTYSGTTGPI